MHKVFVEYKVSPECREAYLSFVREKQAESVPAEWLESAEQPGLFLEIWELADERLYARFRQDRLDSSDSGAGWSRLHAWIDGGPAKIKMWRFGRL